jgi:hypothetical protein
VSTGSRSMLPYADDALLNYIPWLCHSSSATCFSFVQVSTASSMGQQTVWRFRVAPVLPTQVRRLRVWWPIGMLVLGPTQTSVLCYVMHHGMPGSCAKACSLAC